MAEIALELALEYLVRRSVDVVLDSAKVKGPGLGIVHRETGAVVIVTRLADRADTDDVSELVLELEILGRQLDH